MVNLPVYPSSQGRPGLPSFLSCQLFSRLSFAALVLIILIITLAHPHYPYLAVQRTHYDDHSKELSALDLWRIRGPDAQEKLDHLLEDEDDDGEIQGDVQEPAGFLHQDSFHLPPHPIATKHCPPQRLLQDLADTVGANLSSSPFVYHFQNRTLVADPDQTFHVGTEFCSVLFAPQPLTQEFNEYIFHNSPIEGWGPDSIHCEFTSPDIRLIPPHPDYFGALSVIGKTPQYSSSANAEPAVLAVYTIPYTLNHPGTYQINGEVEFQSYDWVMEDPMEIGKDRHNYGMLDNRLVPRSPAITITGKPVSRPDQKCFYKGFTDLHGRWYRAKAFNRDGNQTRLNPDAHLEFAEYNGTIDQFGWTFAPDACALSLFTPADHEACFENRTLQILGDSNSRRLTKSLIGGGVGWCMNTTDRICQCEDNTEEELQDMNYSPIESVHFRNTADRETPTYFGKNSAVYFDFVGGLLNSKVFNPWWFFYDRPRPFGSESKPDHGKSEAEPSIIDTRLGNRTIDVVHISLLGWDIAAIRTPAQMLASLPTFRSTILRAYPPRTRIITRLANAMCCGNTNGRTRYSAPRFRMWNAMWTRFWAADEAQGAIRTVDASVLQGRRDAETLFLCPSTHLRSAHVRLEQMMWMSAVCEKGEGKDVGQVRMRRWGWTAEDAMVAGPGFNELKDLEPVSTG